MVIESPTKKPSKLVRSQAVDDVIALTETSGDDASPTDQARKSAAARRRTSETPPESPTRTRKTPDSPTTPLAPSPPQKADVFTAPPESTNPTPTASSHHTRSRSIDEPVERARDPSLEWYASAYSEAQLRTFHCEKVKKIPLSGLDPSMLLGFLCRTEAEFEDFCERASRVCT